MRGFEIAKGFEDLVTSLPERKTEYSAGYDIAIIEDIVVAPGKIVIAKTGIKAYMQKDEVLKIYPRSSLSIKYSLTLANNVGIIDADYYSNESNDGHIGVALRNIGVEKVILKKGERVAQGIFEKYLICPTEKTVKTVRNGGHGSTGK